MSKKRNRRKNNRTPNSRSSTSSKTQRPAYRQSSPLSQADTGAKRNGQPKPQLLDEPKLIPAEETPVSAQLPDKPTPQKIDPKAVAAKKIGTSSDTKTLRGVKVMLEIHPKDAVSNSASKADEKKGEEDHDAAVKEQEDAAAKQADAEKAAEDKGVTEEPVGEDKQAVADAQAAKDAADADVAAKQEALDGAKATRGVNKKVAILGGSLAAAAIIAGLVIAHPFSPNAPTSDIPAVTTAATTAATQGSIDKSATEATSPSASSTDQTPTTSATDSSAETDEGTWVLKYKTVHHAAVTHTEEVPAVYGPETTYHTVRNDTGEIVDGEAEKYLAENGGPGVTTNVPVTVQVVKQKAYTKTVVDQKAWDEQVPDVMVNSKTGQTRSVTASDLAGLQ